MPAHDTVIIGIGNTLVTDDGVGIYCARHAASLLAQRGARHVAVREAELGGFALLTLLEGFTRAVIIDAIKLQGRAVGEIIELSADDLPPASHLVSGHQIDLATALAFGAQLGLSMPAPVHVIAIQIEDDITFGERLSPAVARAVPEAAALAVTLVCASEEGARGEL